MARDAALVGAEICNATLAASLVSILLNAAIWRFGLPFVDQWRARAVSLEPGEALRLRRATL